VGLEPTTLASGNSSSSKTPQSLSADGQYEVFTSSAEDFIGNDTNGSTQDVFLRDRTAGTLTLVSRAAGGGSANNTSDQAVISADGRYVAFRSSATNLDVTGVNSSSGNSEIYRWDRTTGQIILISVNSGGTNGGNNNAQDPSLSGDGNRVAYDSYA